MSVYRPGSVGTRLPRFFGPAGCEEKALGKGESVMPSYVLIVETHETNRRQVRLLLAEHGYESRVVPSCGDALTTLRLGPPPSVIVLGPTVPTADAEEFRALTRRHPFLARIPLTVLSARAVAPESSVDLAAATEPLDESAWIEAASHARHPDAALRASKAGE
jgi:CheY-like chemotaxis protein